MSIKEVQEELEDLDREAIGPDLQDDIKKMLELEESDDTPRTSLTEKEGRDPKLGGANQIHTNQVLKRKRIGKMNGEPDKPDLEGDVRNEVEPARDMDGGYLSPVAGNDGGEFTAVDGTMGQGMVCNGDNGMMTEMLHGTKDDMGMMEPAPT